MNLTERLSDPTRATAPPAYTPYEEIKALPGDNNSMNAEDQSSILSELESVQQICKNLQQKLDSVDEDAMELRKAQIMSLERVRWQSELADEAQKAAEAALKENRELVAKFAKLENWTDSFEEGEAALTMRKLYQDIDCWAKEHYSRCLTEKCSIRSDIEELSCEQSDQPFDPRQTLSEVHADLSLHIFQSILARFMVGLNEGFGDRLYHIDNEIKKTCPSYIWHHWRCSMSRASASLAKSDIAADCNRIAQSVEDKFSQYSVTDTTRRMAQLKALIWQCIDFKKKLERQGDFYFFWWSSPGRRFREEHMTALTCEDPSDELVERSLWPILFKARLGGHLVVEKELVKTRPRIPRGSIDEGDFY